MRMVRNYDLYCRGLGGLLWGMLPESLLDYQDFLQWRRDNDTEGSVLYPTSKAEFDEWSQQTWTHLTMQIIKVHVWYMYRYMY